MLPFTFAQATQRAPVLQSPDLAAPARLRSGVWALLLALSLPIAAPALAQTFPNLPISPAQRDAAQQVARAGVPLADLAPNAPERHTVRRGDTLWDISALFLRQPWRWPELWGMNLEQIRNPHLIFPGQVLVLTRVGDRAVLALEQGVPPPTVRLSPQVRAQALPEAALPAIPTHLIAPFLNDSLVLSDDAHTRAPRIVASADGRTLLVAGDRAYARGQLGAGSAETALTGAALAPSAQVQRIYRNAVPLLDPGSGETLGFEAQLIGSAQLVRPEVLRADTAQLEPATIDITHATAEIRVGDRLLPAPAQELPPQFVPRAPAAAMAGQVLRVHGHAQRIGGQHQVLVLNRGSRDGLEPGHVLALLRKAAQVPDRTDPAQPTLHLPAERNGLMMVFRSFERVSYALVLQVGDGVRNGDRFASP